MCERDINQNWGLGPDQELNWWPFGLQDDAQPTQPHQSGCKVFFKRNGGVRFPGQCLWAGLASSVSRTESLTELCLTYSPLISCVTPWAAWPPGKHGPLEVLKCCMRTGWCGSVNWAPTCEPKGHWLVSQSGHVPGLQARSPVVGAWEATTHWCFSPSFSFTLPLCLNK